MVVISILYFDKLKASRKNGNDISFLLRIVKIDKKSVLSFHKFYDISHLIQIQTYLVLITQ